MIHTLLPDDHILLAKVLPLFSFITPPVDPVEFAKVLLVNMHHHNALGLAANQIGFEHRVFAIAGDNDKPPMVCYNPLVLETSESTDIQPEGCLSFPYMWIKIKRPTMIKVMFQSPDGEEVKMTLTGIQARCFQHETDHLNGIVFTTRADRFHLEQARRQKKTIKRRTKR